MARVAVRPSPSAAVKPARPAAALAAAATAAPSPSAAAAAPRRIAVVAFDGISPFHLSAPCLVFGDGRHDGGPAFDLRVCSWQPGLLTTSAGFGIQVPHGLGVLRHADVVIVPSWPDTLAPPPPRLLKALRAAHARGAMLVGLCLGAFVLADAGLLDGRSATTHWLFADAFAQRRPQVRLDREALYVDEGRIVTSAGTAASLDCCLHLLRRWFGAERANRVSRRLVLAPHRAGGQAQFIEQPLAASAADARLNELLAWLQAHLAQPHSVDALAARVSMSRRSFTRHFQRATGASVLQWLHHQRLALAGRLLEGSAQSIDHIAAGTGLGSAMNLRQRFKAAYGLSPSAYRSQFRSGN